MTLRGRAARIARHSPVVREIVLKLATAGPTRKFGTIRTARSFSLMDSRRLSTLYDLALGLEREARSGSFVECGVGNGGSSAVVASAARNNGMRESWLFDSWEGMPEPSYLDISLLSGRRGKKGMLQSSMETVRELLFHKLNLDPNRIHLVKGWFAETIPAAKKDIGAIALLVLDCCWYESYKLCLRELYDSVVEGGIVWLDGYVGAWQGCKQATDEFIAERHLDVTMHLVRGRKGNSYWPVYLRRA